MNAKNVKQDYYFIINKNTIQGSKEYVRGAIHGIVSSLVVCIDDVKPSEVYAEPIIDSDRYYTLHVQCSQFAYEAIIEMLNMHYRGVVFYTQP